MLVGLLVLLILVITGAAFAKISHAEKQINELQSAIVTARLELMTVNDSLNTASDELGKQKTKNQEIVSQRKSSETRLGIIAENLVPLIAGLPYDGKNLHHLAQPIDYVYFDYDAPAIIFVEVKTGKAKESKRQKLIKNAIKGGMVHYELLQINDDGVKVTRKA